MGLLTVIRSTLRSIGLHATRSSITMLGVNIGVVAVVAMLAAGLGAREVLKVQRGGLSTTVIVVFPAAFNQKDVRIEAGSASHMAEENARAIMRGCPAVIYNTQQVPSAVPVKHNNKNGHPPAIRVIDPDIDESAATMTTSTPATNYAQVRSY